jgi:hypothetical protein
MTMQELYDFLTELVEDYADLEVTIEVEDGRVVLSVEDNGPVRWGLL